MKEKTKQSVKTKAVKVKAVKPSEVKDAIQLYFMKIESKLNQLRKDNPSLIVPFTPSSRFIRYLYLLENGKLPLGKEINFIERIGKKAGTNFRKLSALFGYEVNKGKTETNKRYTTGSISKL